MSSPVDKIKMPPELDRRRKLTEEDKVEIKRIYLAGGVTQTALAKEYGVSRSLISIVVNPDRAAAVSRRIAEKWREYYDKDKHKHAVRSLRQYKRGLQKEGKL